MGQNEDYIPLVGLALRANRLAVGADAVITALHEHKARLILLSADISGHTRGQIVLSAENAACPLITIPHGKETLGQALGRAKVSAAALTDIGLANAVIQRLVNAYPEQYTEVSEILKRKYRRANERRTAHQTGPRKVKSANGDKVRKVKSPDNAGIYRRKSSDRDKTYPHKSPDDDKALKKRPVRNGRQHIRPAHTTTGPPPSSAAHSDVPARKSSDKTSPKHHHNGGTSTDHYRGTSAKHHHPGGTSADHHRGTSAKHHHPGGTSPRRHDGTSPKRGH